MSKKKSMAFLWSFFIIAVWLFWSQQLFAQAQQAAVPVEQEPRHRIVFQNQNVRIYDCLIPPGDQTLFHTHSFDNVAIAVSGGTGRNEMSGRPAMESSIRTGNVGFSKATNAPYTHRLENVGTTPPSIRCPRGALFLFVPRRPSSFEHRAWTPIGVGK